MAKVLVTHYISAEIGHAAVTFARQAIELENRWPWDGKDSPQRSRANGDVRQLTIGAVIVAVAALESMLNEFLEGAPWLLGRLKASQTLLSSNEQPPKHITAHALNKLIALGPIRELDTNAYDKLNLILATAGLQEVEKGSGVGQQLSALITLRNELVHNVPMARPHGKDLRQNERDSLENTLRGKYKPSTIVHGGYSFCWERALSADCARWAVSTMDSVTNTWMERIGASARVGTDYLERVKAEPAPFQ